MQSVLNASYVCIEGSRIRSEVFPRTMAHQWDWFDCHAGTDTATYGRKEEMCRRGRSRRDRSPADYSAIPGTVAGEPVHIGAALAAAVGMPFLLRTRNNGLT